MATSPHLPRVEGPPPDDPLPGTMLGEFKVERAVAAGGMGIVYLARHRLLGRKVAVKVLRPEFAKDEQQELRFLKEAQALSAIHHRGIIEVNDFGKLPDGRQFMVMDFLEGETLETMLQREKVLHPNRALPMIDEIMDALSAAHKVGVVHRDLKPSNVFLTMQSNGTRYCKLVDFGLARAAPMVLDPSSVQAFDKASLMAGTPEYISPEQAQGFAGTPRSDLYAAGVMLFEMLSGQLPFTAQSVTELLEKQAFELAPRLNSITAVPDGLDELVAALLQKEPEARPRSADTVRQAIARVMKEMKEAATGISRLSPVLVRPSAPRHEPVLDDTYVRPPAVAASRMLGEPVSQQLPIPPLNTGPVVVPRESLSAGRGHRNFAPIPDEPTPVAVRTEIYVPPPAAPIPETEVSVPLVGPMPEVVGDAKTTNAAAPLVRKTKADGPAWFSVRNIGLAAGVMLLGWGGFFLGSKLFSRAPAPPQPQEPVVVAPPVEPAPPLPAPLPPPVPTKKGPGKTTGKSSSLKAVATPGAAQEPEVGVVQASAAEFAEAECEGDWKDLATERLNAATERRKAKVAGGVNAEARTKEIDTRDFELRVLVNEAKTSADCKEALLQVGVWAK